MRIKEEGSNEVENMMNGDMANNVKSIDTASQDALQSNEYREVMDAVDRLRSNGLGGILQLPQLVVAGDQSSGKSSSLEAITEIPFPRKENLCTRFATEVIMRRGPTPSISTKITPDEQRPETEKKRLEGFKSSIKDLSELPNLIEEAAKLMGLGDDTSGPPRAFSRDILSIEVAGPRHPHLTLVDLPGLIHSETRTQSQEDVKLIEGLVDKYIKEQRTIIIAVVSAKNDYSNQVILKKSRMVDRMGHRTLGIITKPDSLEADSESENSWIQLANNNDVFFDLGWHILKNRSDKEISQSFRERNAGEAAFFSNGRYRDLPPQMLGVASLRNRLSQLLFKHLKAELPKLQEKLNGKLKEVCHELESLGEKPLTSQEQRLFLMNMSTTYHEVVKAAVGGQYEYPKFFGDLDLDGPLDHHSNVRRLRAVVQHFNQQFSEAMRKYGHTTDVVEDKEKGEKEKQEEDRRNPEERENPEDFKSDASDDVQGNEVTEKYASFAKQQESMNYTEVIEMVEKTLIRVRGRELPGIFNSLVVSELFQKHSTNWKGIAECHIERVAEACERVVRDAVKFYCPKAVAARLQSMKVDDALQRRRSNAAQELENLIEDTQNHPMTYDLSFAENVVETSDESNLLNVAVRQIDKALEHKMRSSTLCALRELREALVGAEPKMSSAKLAWTTMQKYYKDEVEYFIRAVTKQVIERHLMRDLAEDTLSPITVTRMTDEEVAFVTAEPEDTASRRDFLEARKATLKKAQEIFKFHAGPIAVDDGGPGAVWTK